MGRVVGLAAAFALVATGAFAQDDWNARMNQLADVYQSPSGQWHSEYGDGTVDFVWAGTAGSQSAQLILDFDQAATAPEDGYVYLLVDAVSFCPDANGNVTVTWVASGAGGARSVPASDQFAVADDGASVYGPLNVTLPDIMRASTQLTQLNVQIVDGCGTRTLIGFANSGSPTALWAGP